MAGPNMSIPTVAIVGPAGRLIINEVDLPEYRTRGFRLESESAPEVVETPAVSFDGYKVSELKEFAEAAGIDGFVKMKKAGLIEALEADGYSPKDFIEGD